MLSLGIAFAAREWRVALWDEDRTADLHALRDPDALWTFLQETTGSHPAIPCVLPSGLGVPVTRARDLLDRDIFEMTFRAEPEAAEPLSAFLAHARHRLPTAFCIPGVKGLPSVPLSRKLSRVDMGGAEVVCAAGWSLHLLGRNEAPQSFVLLHLGPTRREVLAVDGGRVVDGIGGSVAGLGPDGGLEGREPAAGAGPAAWWLREGTRVKEAEARSPGCGRTARWEALEKEVLALAGAYDLKQVIVTGEARAVALEALPGRLEYRSLPSQLDGYEPALGAAVLAAGLTGGPTAPLVDRLALREARDRVLDFLRP
jgi:predicted butyrate kinase (DUF1464 family)